MGGIDVLSSDFFKELSQEMLYIFLVGFLPGSYFSYLKNMKSKISSLSALIFAFIIGIISGSIGIVLFFGFAGSSQHSISFELLSFFINNLTFIIGLELIIILAHYFFFRKRGKKNIVAKNKSK